MKAFDASWTRQQYGGPEPYFGLFGELMLSATFVDASDSQDLLTDADRNLKDLRIPDCTDLPDMTVG